MNTRTLDAAWHAAEAIRDRFAELNGPLSRDSHHDALVILESLAALRAQRECPKESSPPGANTP